MVNLRFLGMADGELTGPIPEPLGRLRFLEVSHLSSNNGLIGPIPDSIGRLRFLEVLDISYNELTGPIPTFIGQKLSKLDLSFNQLNGLIPQSFGKLASLTYLDLQSNRLTVSIPLLIGKLYKLDLSVNRLNSSIPESLGRLVSLQEISLNSNLLSGPIPVSLGKLDRLQYLDVSNNSLEGVVSEAHFAKLSTLMGLITSFNTRNLGTLLLSNTKISGPLPTWLRKTPTIHLLDLSHNKLSGLLTNLPFRRNVDTFDPNVFGVLFLVNNIFNESIPKSLCTRKDLGYLDLSKNRTTQANEVASTVHDHLVEGQFNQLSS
uniref:Leucine-rich repeat-containing N-terminal plant-type domain-containing protein n=1 Tax=Lactuca sativa TaxID=4236 RepID=A0A9R1XAN0_LACSA|nr:hypothetical protein LSAT_V11C500243840 [Lactuca sativa]